MIRGPSLTRTVWLLVASVALIGVANANMINQELVQLSHEYGRHAAIRGLISDCFILLTATFFCLLVLVRWPRVLQFSLPFLFSVASLPNFFSHFYSLPVSTMVKALRQTNVVEAAGFLDRPLVLTVALTGLIGFILALPLGPKYFLATQDRKSAKIVLGFLVIASSMSLVSNRPGAVLSRLKLVYSPMAIFFEADDLKARELDFVQRAAKRRDIFAEGLSIEPQNDDLTVVLVVGESARADHFSLNGYARKTDPELEKMRNLVSFTNAWSCYPFTYLAVPCILTRGNIANISDHVGTENGIVAGFRKLGFHTAWLTTMSHWVLESKITYMENFFLLAQEAEEQRFSWGLGLGPRPGLNSDDPKDLMIPFDQMLERGGRNFVVFQTSGSHAPYQHPYIHGTSAPFQPVCNLPSGCDDAQYLINSYDNTIVHTDRFLATIIKHLAGRNALFLYVSDHGESLGEDRDGKFVGAKGTFGHGHETSHLKQLVIQGKRIEQRHIPMIWWASDHFLANPANAARFARLKVRSDLRVSQENVFHSLLDCSGIEAKAKDELLSLCGYEEPLDYLRLVSQMPD